MTTRHDLETDHLLSLVESMAQSGRTESQINAAIGRSLRDPRPSWSERLRSLGRRARWADAPAAHRSL
jgi:hypothetical protein